MRLTQPILTQALHSHHSRSLALQKRLNCHRNDLTFIHRLIDDPNITCKPADKNLGLVLVDTCWYDFELERMLKDQVTYAKFDGTLRLHGKVQKVNEEQLKVKLLAELHSIIQRHSAVLELWLPDHFEQIKKFLKHRVTPKTAAIPGIYLLIKVHKPKGLCGRPIVPCTRWVTTPASILVDHLLQEILREAKIRHIVKDTKSFVNELEQTPMTHKDGVFVTADIASLYTNIDTEDGLRLIEQFLLDRQVPSERRRFIMDLLRFVMCHSYLTFKGQVYHQKDGTAMGTATAPTYANIFVYILEVVILAEFGADLYLYRRFLDDIFAYLSASVAERFQTRMNQLHRKLKFEFSSDPNEAAFLDLHIYKGKRFEATGLFDLRVHQKKMNLYLYIPFLSYHTLAAKKSFIQTELMRYIRNSSDRDDYIALKRIFFQRLRDRGYPQDFLLPLFNSISYRDRHYFLYPSKELLDHPTIRTQPPVSLCLTKRIDRADRLARTSLHLLPELPPPVFVIPYTPLSHVVPTRDLLSRHWFHMRSALVNLPQPIIAYQSYPSLMAKLVYQKAKRMEELRVSKWKPKKHTQTQLAFQPIRVPALMPPPTPPNDGPAPMQLSSQ